MVFLLHALCTLLHTAAKLCATFLSAQSMNHDALQAKAELTPGKVETVAGWRYFCHVCGTHLWLWIPDKPDTTHVFASAVDTPLPQPDHFCHIFVKDRLPWVQHITIFAGFCNVKT